MSVEVLIPGSNVALTTGYLGISTVALIREAGRTALFDTGGFATRQGVLDALDARGLAPGDVTDVVMSHLHFDHAHNLELFPRATVHVSATELAYAETPHAADRFMPWGILRQLAEREVRTLGEGDRLWDRFDIMALPGHTPGCIGLGWSEGGRRHVLAGDAVKYPKELLTGRSDLCFAAEADAAATLRRLQAEADVIHPGHFVRLEKRGEAWGWNDALTLPLIVR